MEVLLLIILLCIIWGYKILIRTFMVFSYVCELLFYRIPVAIIKAVKKAKKPEESEATHIVEVNVTVTYVDDMGNKSVVQKKRDIYPFSDDENDIGYNLEMADILFGDD